MSVKITASADPLQEQDIADVEQELDLILPPDYKLFLLAYNGGRPDPDGFPIHNNPAGEYGLLHRFLRVKSGDIYSLRAYYKTYSERIPAGFLPIACDPGGNLLCLATSGENIGQIYFWDHEEEAEEGDTPGYGNVYFVASSFDALLESLTIPA